MEKVSPISRSYNELLIKPNKTPEEERKLEALKRELEMAQKEYRDFLDRMKKEFDTYEKQEYPNIEALRLAQLHLAGFEDMINQSKSIAAPSNSSGEKSNYSNPHYWAPFIMMGDWR